MVCKSCAGRVLPFIDFGPIPLGNAFVRPEDFEAEKKFKLELGLCETCKLVQQTSPPPVESLEADYRNYAYVPVGPTLDRHYQELGATIASGLGRQSFVLDIGSNNGLLLGYIRARSNCKVLGVEPAEKISDMAREAGVPTITGFFDSKTAEDIRKRHGTADVVTVTQVLQHIPTVGQFLNDILTVLKPEGVLVVEGRYFGDTVEKRSYDTVYHEMIYFFTLWSLNELFGRHHLRIFRAERSDIYGGSLRVYARTGRAEPEASVSDLLREESEAGLTKYEGYEQFAKDVFKLKAEQRELIKSIRAKKKTISAYGAPSTSATLLNFSGIDRNDVRYVVDDNPLKQGLFTPGTHIPIVPSSFLDTETPDYLLLLAWRLKDEILLKVKKHRDGGMKVILPLPTVEVV